jgi:hypothetical protein
VVFPNTEVTDGDDPVAVFPKVELDVIDAPAVVFPMVAPNENKDLEELFAR